MNEREQQPETDESVRAESSSENDGHTAGARRRVSRREVLKVAASTAAVAPLIGLEDVLGQRRTNGPARATKTGNARARDSKPAPRFFTPVELAMVDELAEMIIPSDDHSPGARAAGVAAYLDRRLAELTPQIPEHAREQQTWRNGLKLVNDISQEMHGRAFMRATAKQRDAVLRRMAEQEPRPQRPPSSTVTSPAETSQAQQRPKSPTDIYREQSRKPPPPPQEAASPRKSEGEFFVFLKGRMARAYYSSEIGLLQELNYQGNWYLQEFVGYDTNGNYTEAPPRPSRVSPKRRERLTRT